jgi:hypothetical protein
MNLARLNMVLWENHKQEMGPRHTRTLDLHYERSIGLEPCTLPSHIMLIVDEIEFKLMRRGLSPVYPRRTDPLELWCQERY